MRFEPSVRPIPAICPEHDAAFRSITASGNQAYSAGDIPCAEALYERALHQAEAVFERAQKEGGAAALVAPMLINIGCHNLACLRSASGEEEAAFGLIAHAVERLLEGAASVSCPIEMRLNCVRHLRHALYPLANCSELPAGSAAQRQILIQRAASTSAEVVRTAEFVFATDRSGRAGST